MTRAKEAAPAAAKLFAERGYRHVTIRDIALAAGLHRGRKLLRTSTYPARDNRHRESLSRCLASAATQAAIWAREVNPSIFAE